MKRKSKIIAEVSAISRTTFASVMVGLGSTAIGTIAYGMISDLTNLREACTLMSVLGMLSIGAIILVGKE